LLPGALNPGLLNALQCIPTEFDAPFFGDCEVLAQRHEDFAAPTR
jgi:hypothetical protein